MENNLRKKRKRKKKSKQDNYFTIETERAIIEYQEEPDFDKQNKIFVDRISPAFTKLIENMIFVYKFHTLGNIDVLKNDCMSFLFESLYKFNGSKGHAAFSYYNVVCKNWFIQRVKTFKKKTRSDVHFDNTLLSKMEQDCHQAVVVSYESDFMQKEFIVFLKEEIKSWRSKFDKSQEKAVLEAVILLFDNPDMVSLYNKKGIYMYLREITKCNTKQVVTNLTKFRKKYRSFKNRYLEGEI